MLRPQVDFACRSDRAGRARWIVVALAALVVIAVWRLQHAETSSESAPGPIGRSVDPHQDAPQADRATLDRTAASRAPVSTNPSEPAATATTSASESCAFSGRFRFADGSAPPEMSFEVYAELAGSERAALGQFRKDSEQAEREGRCRRWASASTDSAGRFSIPGLCAGRYRVRLDTEPNLAVVDTTFSVPIDDAVIRLDGYALHVVTVDAQDRPLPFLRLTGRVTIDASTEAPQAKSYPIDTKTDESGERWLCQREPGSATFRAVNGLLSSLPETIALTGPSCSRTVRVVLSEMQRGASLRAIVRDCDQPGIEIDDYCLNLYPPERSEWLVRLCTEDLDKDRLFHDVPPGPYSVRLDHRYAGVLDFVLDARNQPRATLELKSDVQSTLELCAHFGGRIALLATDDRRAGAEETLSIEASLIGASDGRPIRLSFRAPDATGVTVDGLLPIGVERATENVLPEGTYDLSIDSKPYSPTRTVVSVYRGRVTHVAVKLTTKSDK